MKRYIKLLLIINLIFLTSGRLIYSQSSHLTSTQAGTNLKFVKYSVEIGLSSNAQRCIAQDREGFIWIGTDDGLNRFDGYTFKIYRKNNNDQNSLRSNMINCLFVEGKGVLWVGTNAGGLSRYDKEKDNFFTFSSDINDSTALLNNDITSIVEDKFHRLWVGTSGGLHLFDPEKNNFIRFTAPQENITNSKTIARNHVKKIIADGDILWIGYTSGILSALNTSDLTFKHYRLFDVSSWLTADFSVNSLVPDNDNIWISTWSKGIWIFNKTTGKCSLYTQEQSGYINFIFKDNRGKIWYSPEHKGLVLLDGNNKINYHFDDYDNYSLSSNSLADIFQDKQGNLWVGSKQGDLNYAILDNPFTTWYKNPNLVHGLTNNLVTAVIEDSKGRIWVGYQDGGIDILDSHKKKPRIHINADESSGLGSGTITYIYESRDGIIWVGKYLDGLKKFNEITKSFSSYRHKEGDDKTVAGNDIRHITEDNDGNLWIAIHGGGVDKFNPATGKFIHYKHDDNNPSTTIISDWTFTAVCDKNNNIWVGTVAGVSVILENNSIVKHYHLNAADGYNLSNAMSRIIFIDSKNFVWIGTIDGLNKLDRKNNTIRKYYTNDGLPNSVIMNILEDNHYNLWITTAKGLSKFSLEKENFKNYFVQDGLVTDEFNVFASFNADDGEMYLGGREGLNKFHPDNIKINYFKPPVYITDFKLFNQSATVAVHNNKGEDFSLPMQINFCEEITLEYYQNVITFEFVALNYINLEKNRYRYKLEGFEKDWTSQGYKREVTYTNLSPGEYNFRVIASNSDGIWNTDGASLKIIVNPPFWRTNWAYALYILFGLSLLYFFRKLILHEAEIKRTVELEKDAIQKLQEMDSLKMQFFSNVSHEFRTPLSLIVGPVENLIRMTKDELQNIQLQIVHRNANRLLRLINQLMDFGKIEEDKLELDLSKNDIIHFLKEIIESFEQDAKLHNIDLAYKYSHSSYNAWFDSDKLDKIIYNLLSNAFKYTPDNGKISVAINLEEKTNIAGINPFWRSESEENKLKPKTFRITIQDSGIGIPKEAQLKIFDRFYQVKNPSNIHGTGIGLSLTYELVKLLKGTIKVESDPSQQPGTEFILTFPLWTEENELPRLSNMLTADQNSETTDIAEEDKPRTTEKSGINNHTRGNGNGLPSLLIIEDNADMRLFIKNEFNACYNLMEAPNGTTGLTKAFEEIPDAIICDIMMPGIDGYEVCKALKQDERTSHIPVVMLTAKSSERHTIEGFESGADDYITKPFSTPVLSARIKNLIESRILLRKKFLKDPFASIKEISPSKTDEMLINKAYVIVEKNMGNPDFEVNDFAYQIGMSRTQLYRKIQAITGQSVKEFIRIIRLKKAAELLMSGSRNISEISYDVGFNSLSYFTTSFTQYFGMTPTRYREKHTNFF